MSFVSLIYAVFSNIYTKQLVVPCLAFIVVNPIFSLSFPKENTDCFITFAFRMAG